MASYTGKAFLSLGRINVPFNGLNNLTSRVTYQTRAFRNSPRENKDKSKKIRTSQESRTTKMPVDQDWTAVYPIATVFRPHAVPLPVRMGYPVKGNAPPEKMGNLELIKIPNFLHLTPAAIKKHCAALRQFCTKWPCGLNTDAECDQFFPVKVDSTDYLSAGTSLRNPSARIVHLRVKLSSLNLDDHARKKMVKLTGERYCKDTDILTITTDSCPMRKQNYDYAMYLLTVLYHESWKTEAWEADKTTADMEEYCWEDSPSQKNILDTLIRMKTAGEDESEEVRKQLLGIAEVQDYKDSITRLKNEGENDSTILQYKEAVKKVLNL